MIGLLLYVLNYIVVFASANPIAQAKASEWDWQQSQWAIKQHFPGGQCRINGVCFRCVGPHILSDCDGKGSRKLGAMERKSLCTRCIQL